ncbi:PorT family protein [Flavobacteriaceae bacterium XHP0103]|uniref:porin family protein n=1 Tax=Marixanthotalea marina TaxID=2844359 RepID=UPI002989CA6A|nr:porin family protein [Marixanthotalea marina]MBU3820875.1 PorT family protein [Marixanthotalea marina]
MKWLSLFVLVMFSYVIYAQETNSTELDSLYREDQFYLGVTYNVLGNQPRDLSQNGFSLGFHAGFIRDIPINKARNVAIGIGLGYSTNSFNQNMLIYKDDMGDIVYSVLDDENISFSKNKFSQHLIEVPLEFRWRTSTPADYKFWRIYAGLRIGYVFTNTSKFIGSIGEYKYKNLDNFNNFQYGLSLSAGYNTWNLYFYYALNPIFNNEAKYGLEPLKMNAVKIGLMFYVL